MNHAGLVRASTDALVGAQLHLYAATPGADVRRGEGWTAVATGVEAPDMNGVVSEPGAAIDVDTASELIAWFADLGVPATWTVTGDDTALTATLVAAGARPERTTNVCGRALDDELLAALAGRTERWVNDHELTVERVTTARTLDHWLDVADVCGRCADDRDRDARARLYTAVGLDHPQLAHWVARLGGTPVGMATAFWDGAATVDLRNLGVIPATQRRGIGTALANVRLAVAHRLGAKVVVTELSPDGWKLYKRFGFVALPARPDRAFHLPTRPLIVR